MQIVCPARESFTQALKEAPTNSLDFIVIVTAALNPSNVEGLRAHLTECVRALKKGGLLFVQGRPDYLPELGVYLDQQLTFKYWIAIESIIQRKGHGLPSAHAAVLLFVKGAERFDVRRVRFPHQRCVFCKRTLKDWGGKAHLMHPEGYVISDVWISLPSANNYTRLSTPVLETILRMLDLKLERQEGPIFQEAQASSPADGLKGIIGPQEGLGCTQAVAELPIQYTLPGFAQPTRRYSNVVSEPSSDLYDVVHCGDALEVLRRYPDNSIDLAFADPPYNLDKSYTFYDDERAEERYIA